MGTIANVKVGVCSVTFNSTDLGHTKGGVTVSYEPTYHDITVDEYGETVAEKVLIGENFTATVPLAESTLANVMVAIPGSTDATDAATIGRKAGRRMSNDAATLVLHPIANAAEDRSEDVVLYSAVVSESVEVPFMVDGERVLECTFQAMIDSTKSDGTYLGLIGDSA